MIDLSNVYHIIVVKLCCMHKAAGLQSHTCMKYLLKITCGMFVNLGIFTEGWVCCILCKHHS